MAILATEAVRGAATVLRISLVLVASGGIFLCVVDGFEWWEKRELASFLRFAGDVLVTVGAALTSFALTPSHSFASKWIPVMLIALGGVIALVCLRGIIRRR
jgi:hypothetical protein